MNERTLSLVLISSVLLAFLSGLVTLVLGQARAKLSRPLLGLGLLGLVVSFVMSWVFVSDNGFRLSQWSVGWVVSVPEISKIRVGIVLDTIGLFVGSVAITLCLLILFVSEAGTKLFREGRAAAALCFSVAGTTLSWLSASPWLVFAGMLLTTLGGFISLSDSAKGEKLDSAKNASDAAPRFLLEKSLGFLLCLAGVLMLTGSGVEVGWPIHQPWHTGGTIRVAASFFCLGTILQFGAFPLNSTGALAHSWSVPSRLFSVHLAPAWAALVFLFRMHSQLMESETLPYFGWFILSAAVLSTVSGLFQPSWRRSLSAAVAVSFCLVCGALIFSSQISALALMIGFGFSALTIAIAGQISSDGPGLETIRRKKSKLDGPVILLTLGSLGFSGFFGFVGCWGFVRWLHVSAEHAWVAALSCIAIFLFVVLAWKVNWLILSVKSASKASWRGLVAGGLCVLAALSVFWVGEATGLGFFPLNGAPGNSFLAKIVDTSFVSVKPVTELVEPGVVVWVYAALIVIAALVAFTMQNTWTKIYRAIPKTSAFVASGYGISTAAMATLLRVRLIAAWTEELTAQRFWSRWLSDTVSTVLRGGSRVIYRTDEWLARNMNRAFNRSLDLSIRVPSVVQNGDVQWYLFFAVVCTILILVNFMRD